jgi:hypothetical protein
MSPSVDWDGELTKPNKDESEESVRAQIRMKIVFTMEMLRYYCSTYFLCHLY